MPISKPDMQNIWAEAGAISVPPSADISEGWVVEKPPFEEANFVENRQDTGIAYLFQEGIGEWDSYTSYVTNSVVKHLGVVYKSLGANTDKQPDVFPANWAIAFDSYGSADQVQQELDALILDDDPFPQYVKEAGAIFTSRAESTSFSADGGLPTGNDSDVGFTFDLEGDTGTFKDGSDIVTMLNGVEKLRIKPSPVLLENSNAPVTMADLKVFWQQFVQIKVDDFLFTDKAYATPTEVNADRGYGVWVKHAEGRAIVGHSSSTSNAIPDWVKTSGTVFGSYDTTLTTENLPAHKHTTFDMYGSSSIPLIGNSSLPSTVCIGTVDSAQYTANATPMQTGDAGLTSPESVNNVQPSIVVYIWKRVA